MTGIPRSPNSPDQTNRLQLHFSTAAAETGELEISLLAGEMPPGLVERADRPADVAHDFPVFDTSTVDWLATSLLVPREILFGLTDSSEAQVIHPKTPFSDKSPAKIFRWLAQVGKLPVDDAFEAVRAHERVPDAKISVNQDQMIWRRWLVLSEPAHD